MIFRVKHVVKLTEVKNGIMLILKRSTKRQLHTLYLINTILIVIASHVTELILIGGFFRPT